MSKPIKFISRGLGSEYHLPCFATGAAINDDVKCNIAAFVNSPEDALRVMGIIGWLGRVTWDPPRFEGEPMQHIQVKIGVSKGHEHVIEELDRLTHEAGNVITPEIVKIAKAAKPAPRATAVAAVPGMEPS